MFAETQAQDHDDSPFHAMEEDSQVGSASHGGPAIIGDGGAPAAAGQLFRGMYGDLSSPGLPPPQHTRQQTAPTPPVETYRPPNAGEAGGRLPGAGNTEPPCRVNPNTGRCPPPARVRRRRPHGRRH